MGTTPTLKDAGNFGHRSENKLHNELLEKVQHFVFQVGESSIFFFITSNRTF